MIHEPNFWQWLAVTFAAGLFTLLSYLASRVTTRLDRLVEAITALQLSHTALASKFDAHVSNSDRRQR